MNIILRSSFPDDIAEKYTVLELDTFRVPDQAHTVTAYAVISDIGLADLPRLQESQDLHRDLVKNYRLRHWDYCLQVIEHLRERWNGGLISFYDDLARRIHENKSRDLPAHWDGSIDRGQLDVVTADENKF